MRILSLLICSLFYVTAAFGQGTWYAYVCNAGDNTVSVLDVRANTVVGSPISVINPSVVAITPNGKRAYVCSNNLPGAVYVIDVATNTIMGEPIVVDKYPDAIAISPDGTKVIVGNNYYETSTVTVINTMTNTVVGKPIEVGLEIKGVAITPDGKKAYVCCFYDSYVYVIDLATNTLLYKIRGNKGPVAIAVTPDNSKAFVCNGMGGVSVIDIATDTFLSNSIVVGQMPLAVAISPNGDKVYVCNSGEGTVSVIDIATLTVVNTVAVGSYPRGIAVAPDAKTFYVCNDENNTVSVIDTATYSPVGDPLGVGVMPWGIAITPDQAPIASFTATQAQVGSLVTFDASASTTAVGTIVSYAWDFGDGQTATTTSPVITHTYASSGSFTATLIVTNSTGTSIYNVFTGQTMSRSNDPTAMTSLDISVSDPAGLSGWVIKDRFLTRTDYVHHLEWDKSTDPTVVSYLLLRNGKSIGTRPATGPFVFNDGNRGKHQQDVYVLQALNSSGAVVSSLTVTVGS